MVGGGPTNQQGRTITHPSALVEADVDGSLEEDEVALGELEGFKLRPQRVALVRSLEVLEQVRVDGAPGRKKERKKLQMEPSSSRHHHHSARGCCFSDL